MFECKYIIPVEELKRYYVEQKLSTNEIGRIYKCNNGTIWARLQKYGIPIRTNKLAAREGSHTYCKYMHLPAKDIIHKYVDLKMSLKLIAKDYGCSGWVISDRLRKNNVPRRPREEALTDYGRAVLWSPKIIERRTKAEKKLWLNKDWKSERLKLMALGANRKPNKPETIILELLNKRYPNEWEYTGDGSVILGGLNPDFININGEKLIIEVFGDYWHSKKKVRRYHETEIGRIKAYQKYGFKTLVIWENELKKMKAVETKINKFVGVRRV